MFLLKEKKIGKRNDNWNFWILVFLVQKWPFRDAYVSSKRKFAEIPIFIVFWGCALFGPSCQKREILDTHPKRKILTDNWKAHFWFSFGFSCFFSFCFCFFVFFKGQVRWPEGPPHLALNPPYLFLFCFCFFFVPFLVVFLEGLRVRWGGPKGHLTWP